MSDDKAWPFPSQKPVRQDMADIISQFKELEDLVKIERKSPRSLGQRIRDLRDQREAIERQLEDLQKAQEFLDTLEFREGDVAVHKEYGNVLVKAIEVDETNLENSKYVVVGIRQQTKVPYKDLMPLNDTTRTLYGNKPK